MLHFLSSWLLQTRKGSIFMDKTKVWNEILETLIRANFDAFQQTKEHEYLHQRKLYLNELMENELSTSQKTMIEEIIYEFGSMEEANADRMYAQGMKDCVIILKNLGVLE